MARVLYTIGHSSHDLERLVALLREHAVTAVADVRSVPYSRRHPQFQRERLAASLRAQQIGYVFLGQELGARSPDPTVYEDGRVSFARLAATARFHAGLARLRLGVSRECVALMCAEREPLDCHRTLLVCRALRDELAIGHILADGGLEPHAATERRLIERAGSAQGELFATADSLARAYEREGRRIAYAAP